MKATQTLIYPNASQLFRKIQLELSVTSRSEDLIIPPAQFMNYRTVAMRVTRNDDIQEHKRSAY
jgi:hypothetical protein